MFEDGDGLGESEGRVPRFRAGRSLVRWVPASRWADCADRLPHHTYAAQTGDPPDGPAPDVTRRLQDEAPHGFVRTGVG
ncbi:hypothetical protein [Streptomyces sp. SID3343]|uniref:hypothetical protein n=1 Tax=Streptomyces sp. SID3343 TaxID=2690260 RepID=UPI001371E241|nr:hypothetical protein [Streptomyces sp. SID3343]MYV97087.1 hypothetical protein [Streptomyces sp. SID3343]